MWAFLIGLGTALCDTCTAADQQHANTEANVIMGFGLLAAIGLAWGITWFVTGPRELASPARMGLGAFALALSLGALAAAVGLSSFAAAAVLMALGGIVWGIAAREILNLAERPPDRV
jgi:hypothetical protein